MPASPAFRVGSKGGRGGVVSSSSITAHKPDALRTVLATLRPFATGRLSASSAAAAIATGRSARSWARRRGGLRHRDRDGRQSASEDPAAIRGRNPRGRAGAREIGDRDEAIRTAVRLLQPGDVLVVAGKGHETGQIVGDRTLPFSDQDCVRAAIAEVTS